MRRPGLDPQRLGGCGAQPDAEFSTQRSRVDRNSNWADQLHVWLTPPGFVELASRHSPRVARTDEGWSLDFDVPTQAVTYVFRGSFDQDFRLRRIETWTDDTVFGNMLVEAEFSDYREFDGVTFPVTLVQKQGGFGTLTLTIDDVRVNEQAMLEVPPVPAQGGGGGGGGGPAGSVPYVLIGEGVYVITGPYQGVVVESDLLQPWILPMFGGAGHPYLQFLASELERLDLDYEHFVPIHGLAPEPTMPKSALLEAVN